MGFLTLWYVQSAKALISIMHDSLVHKGLELLFIRLNAEHW